MKLSCNDFSTPIASALYALGMTPNQMIFWVLLVAAEAAFEEPLRLTAIRCQLYGEIEKSVGLSPKAIDSLIRRASRGTTTNPGYAPLRPYLPADATQPPSAGVFLSAWVRMASDYVTAENKENVMR